MQRSSFLSYKRCYHYPSSSTVAEYSCGSNQFTCASGQCVNTGDRCNEQMDCDDGSDELDCRKSSHLDSL